jgi:hypothetical protein
MRAAPLVILAAALAAPAADLDPGDRAAPARLLLEALAAGRAGALAEADPWLFRDPPALIDPTDSDLLRPWTAWLPAALERLAPGDRAAAVALLDARFTTLGGSPRGFLPATGARAALAAAADRAWDRGRFPAFLALAADHDPRRALAESFDRPVLGAPGGVAMASSTPAAPGGTVRWEVAPGRLTALGADDGAPRWQRRLAQGAVVVTGRDGALVRDADGLRRIAADGRAQPLPAVPARIRPLAVDGAVAWAGDGTTAWRIAATVAAFPLPEPMMGPPLVVGERSLWPGRRRLWLIEGVRPVAWWWHGREPAPALAWSAGGTAMVVDGGLVPLTGPGDDAAGLIAAGRGGEALAAAPDLAVAWLAAPDRASAPATAGGPAWARAALAVARGDRAAAAAIAAAEPDLALPGSAPAADDWPFPAAWPHQRSGRGWALAPAAVAGGIPASGPLPTPLVDGPGRLRLERRDDDYRLACADGDAWWWRRQWRGPDERLAPATSVWTIAGVAWVAAGDLRLWAFDRATGDDLGSLDLAPGDRGEDAVWTRAGIAVPGADALGPRIRFAAGALVRFEDPLRWIVPGGDGVVAADDRGRLWRATPDRREPLADPAGLAAGPRPEVTAEGLRRDGRGWRW